MKLECSVEKIKIAVSQAERITGKNLTLPVLSAIIFEAKGKFLKLKSMNLSLGIEIDVPAKILEEGVLALPGSVVNNIFSNIFENENVSLESFEGNLLIKTKKNKIKVKGVSFEDFPSIPVVSGDVFEINSKKIIDGIKSVYYSASVSDIKPEISSVYIYSNEDYLVFVSTDSFRLAEKKVLVKGVGEIPGILIPHKNIPEILRVFSETEGDVKVCFNKNQISFSLNGVYLTSRIIDGVYPDYRQIIPKSFTTEAVLLKQDLLNALKLSNIFSDKFNQLDLTVSSKQKLFEISSSNNDVGENKTQLSGAVSGEDITLSFNYKYLLDGLVSITTDSISIQMNDGSKPIVVSCVGDKSFTYLIMPMNR